MDHRKFRHQHTFADIFLPFCTKLSGVNRWIQLPDLNPWDEMEDADAAQFCKSFRSQVQPFRVALGALIIKARLGLTDEDAEHSLSRR
jgi:IS5 family transposase